MTSITLILSLNILANENLYKPMDEKKINEAIKTLKPKIRSGIDNNSNEMIKCTSDLIINKIKVIFNLIFDWEYYPKSWNYDLKKSIDKSGSKDDPSNYLGITSMSCLGKLYRAVLYKRIHREVENSNVMSKLQPGFRKKTDNWPHFYIVYPNKEVYQIR